MRLIALALLPLLLLTPMTAARAGGATTETHVLALSSFHSMPDMLLGQAPSLEHPNGTILVLGVDAELSASITEWDLETLERARSVTLPLGGMSRLTMVRAGDYIHVLGVNGKLVRYVTLTKQLRVETAIDIEHGEDAQMATDGTIVAIQWCDASGALAIDVRDALGELRARYLAPAQDRRCIPMSEGKGPYGKGNPSPIAVLAGQIYSLSQRFAPGVDDEVLTELARLDAKGHVLAEVDREDEAILWAVRGRLLIEAWDPGGRTCRFEEVDPTELRSTRRHNFALDPIGPGVCPHPDEVGPPAGADGKLLSSPLESGAQSHASRGEDIPDVDGRVLYRDGVPYLLEFDQRTNEAWLTWADRRPAKHRQTAIDDIVPLVAAHAVTLPLMDEAPDAVAGQGPGPAHPRGTVFVLGRERDAQRPTLSEWDLGTGTAIGLVTLPMVAKAYRLVSTRAKLFVIAVDGRDDVHCIRLTPALHIQADDKIGHGQLVDAEGNDQVGVFAWGVRPPSGLPIETTSLRVVDAAGRVLSSPKVTGDLNSMAVSGRGVYTVAFVLPVAKDERTPVPAPYHEILQLDSYGQVRHGLRSQELHWPHLYAGVGRLLFGQYPERFKALSPDLGDLGDLGAAYSLSIPVNALDDDRDPGLSVGPEGRLVSTRGDVLKPDLTGVERRFAVGPLATRAMWIGAEPAILDWRNPEIPPRIRWADP